MNRTIITVAAALLLSACGGSVTAKIGTNEGAKFTDFTIQQVEGDESSKVSLSDYVGKGKYVLVDFWASWCGPCRMISPYVDEIAEEYDGKATVVKCNVDDCEDIAAEFGIRNIPTLLFFKGGQVVDRLVGAVPKKQMTDKLDAIL